MQIRHHVAAARDGLAHPFSQRRQRLLRRFGMIRNLKSEEFHLQRSPDQILNHRVVNLMCNPLARGNAFLKTHAQSFCSPPREPSSDLNNNSNCKANCQYQEPLCLPEERLENDLRLGWKFA